MNRWLVVSLALVGLLAPRAVAAKPEMVRLSPAQPPLPLVPACAGEMSERDPGFDLDFRRGFVLRYLSPVHQNLSSIAADCRRWKVSATLRSKLNLRRWQKSLRTAELEMTLTYRWMHYDVAQQLRIEPGFKVFGMVNDLPNVVTWLTLTLGGPWQVRIEQLTRLRHVSQGPEVKAMLGVVL